jgi:hypothetical protein
MDLYRGQQMFIEILEAEALNSKLRDKGRTILWRKILEYYKDQKRIIGLVKERNKNDFIDICISLGHLSIKLDQI